MTSSSAPRCQLRRRYCMGLQQGLNDVQDRHCGSATVINAEWGKAVVPHICLPGCHVLLGLYLSLPQAVQRFLTEEEFIW